MLRTLAPVLLLAACSGFTDIVGTPTEPVDLVSPLGPAEARAGVIADEDATTGGLMAEARVGDVLLRNDRARFVLQGVARESGGLVPHAGGVIDADVVRDDGTADVDLVVDWLPA